MLSTQHYNIDVYSQMDDRNDNSYIEVSIILSNIIYLFITNSFENVQELYKEIFLMLNHN